MKLKDKVAVITGGAHGIGRAYCLGFAADGAKVVVADIDEKGAIATAQEILAKGGEALALETDISVEKSTEEMAKRAIKRFGAIDILVNNAAFFSRVPMSRATFDKISLPEWEKMMAVNLTGAFLCTRAIAPQMKARGGGKIINISSSAIFGGTGNRVHYLVTRAGIIGMTRGLAHELGQFNINVNCVAPGSTQSEELDIEDYEEKIEFRKRAIPSRALKRVEYPEDLVGTVIFLASKDSDFITGQTIVVDGGNVMH